MDDEDDDVLPPPIQEEDRNYPVENEEVSWLNLFLDLNGWIDYNGFAT